MQDEIVFRFVDEGIAASARLLRERAPETCRAVSDALPAAGSARHGIYSGSEVYLVLPVLLGPPREHATTIVAPGDVGFLTVEKGSGYGIAEDYSEAVVLRPRRDALDARRADRRQRLRPALRRRRLLRRLPAHAAGGREEARDRRRLVDALEPPSSRCSILSEFASRSVPKRDRMSSSGDRTRPSACHAGGRGFESRRSR